MARPNGKLSEKQVSTWFAQMAFDKQRAFLGSLNETHDSANRCKSMRCVASWPSSKMECAASAASAPARPCAEKRAPQ